MAEVMSEMALNDLKLFTQYLRKLVWLSRRTLGTPRRIRDADHAGFMIWTFSAKMTYHAESLLVLLSQARERDAASIARTMIEGVGHLFWALDDRETRPELWRAFAAVEDYRLAQCKLGAGEVVPPERRDHIAAVLNTYGHNFLKGRKTRMPKLFTPRSEECFRRDWVPPDQHDAWKRVPAVVDLQRHFYGAYSRWLHWNVAGLASMLHRDGRGMSFVPQDLHERVAAVIIGCQCVRHVLLQSNQHFRLGIRKELRAIDRDCLGQRINLDDRGHR